MTAIESLSGTDLLLGFSEILSRAPCPVLQLHVLRRTEASTQAAPMESGWHSPGPAVSTLLSRSGGGRPAGPLISGEDRHSLPPLQDGEMHWVCCACLCRAARERKQTKLPWSQEPGVVLVCRLVPNHCSPAPSRAQPSSCLGLTLSFAAAAQTQRPKQLPPARAPASSFVVAHHREHNPVSNPSVKTVGQALRRSVPSLSRFVSLRNATSHVELLSLRAGKGRPLPPVDRGTEGPQPDVRNPDAGGPQVASSGTGVLT